MQTSGGDDARARCRDGIRGQVLRRDEWLRRDAELGGDAKGVVEADRRVDELDVLSEVRRDGVLHRDNALAAGAPVPEDIEVGREDLVRLANRNTEREPVTGRRRGLRGNAVLLEEGVDGVHSLLRRRDERLDL